MVDRVKNVEIRDNLKEEGVKRRQVRWRIALEEMDPARLVKRVYDVSEMEAKKEME